MRTLLRLGMGLAVCSLVACGDSDSGGGGGPTPECTSNGDCDPGQVCQPYTQTCEAQGAPCTTQAECTDATYCETSVGACLPASTGTPCESAQNCEGECFGGFCGCSGLAHEQQLGSGALDAYLVLDRTGSMGTDCDYTPMTSPPQSSKACYATYALSEYLTGVVPIADTRLAFQFMSQPDDCDGSPYLTPLVGMTNLPVATDAPLIQMISAEDFSGGLGTHIEGALRGIAGWTAANQTSGREMIGVLITDGDPNGCQGNIDALAQIIADHRTATGIRTFIIGMEGATESNLERLAIAGGADPHDDYCGGVATPCHYFNVGDGSGTALANALQAIVEQAVPLPCEFDVTGLTPPPGEDLDYGKVNVALVQDAAVTTIGQVDDAASCPSSQPAWYYDNPTAPTQIHLCPAACTIVTNAVDGARINLVVGCSDTVVVD